MSLRREKGEPSKSLSMKSMRHSSKSSKTKKSSIDDQSTSLQNRGTAGEQSFSQVQTTTTSDRECYDFTPVQKARRHTAAPCGYTVDPFEFSPEKQAPERRKFFPESESFADEEDFLPSESKGTFLEPADIHPNIEHREEEIQRLRLLANRLNKDWGHADVMAPALARRIRDFQFAQEKRRKKYGDERPWGILGVYDHLTAIRIDVEWAEDAARRRANGEPYQSWADFDESKKTGSNRPYFTYFLLVVCTIVMFASIAVNDWSVEPIDENPLIGPSAETLILMGAKESYLIVEQREGWRLITSSFLHGGFVHFFINMMALWFVGAAIEMTHGSKATMIVYSLSSLGGTILSAIFLPDFITVGASGGIFGFVGACLADIIVNWQLLFSDFVNENGKKHRHAFVVFALLFDIALNAIIGLTPLIDNYTHLGGMFYGFLIGLSTIERLSAVFFGIEEEFMAQAKHVCFRFFGLIVTIIFIVTTLIILMNGDPGKTPCPGCTWLSCVPFPPWEDNSDKWWYCDECGRVSAEIITYPTLRLEMPCPSGVMATIELDEENYDRDRVEKDLPNYCRKYCPIFEAKLQETAQNGNLLF